MSASDRRIKKMVIIPIIKTVFATFGIYMLILGNKIDDNGERKKAIITGLTGSVMIHVGINL